MDTKLIEYKQFVLAACLLKVVLSDPTIMMTNVDSYTDKMPDSSVIYTSLIVRSSLECVYQCNLMTCDTTFYQETSGMCILMTTGAVCPQMITSPGFNMYRVYCADGGFFRAGSLCIQFNRNKRNWNEALTYCQHLNRNAHLLDLQTTDKKNTFDSFAGGVATGLVVWIGANDIANENNYKWTDGTSVTFNLFNPDINNKDATVNSNDADCLAYRYSSSFDLIDEDCSKSIHSFVCEIN